MQPLTVLNVNKIVKVLWEMMREYYQVPCQDFTWAHTTYPWQVIITFSKCSGNLSTILTALQNNVPFISIFSSGSFSLMLLNDCVTNKSELV